MSFVHLEYPRCLHGAGGATCLVNSDAERDAKLAEGWSLLPVLDAPEPANEPDGLQATVDEQQAIADAQDPASAPKKRGRKPKA